MNVKVDKNPELSASWNKKGAYDILNDAAAFSILPVAEVSSLRHGQETMLSLKMLDKQFYSLYDIFILFLLSF